MSTIQILTKNNQKTISSTIESLLPTKSSIIIGDLGSNDNTIDICNKYDVEVINLGDMPRNEARNKLLKEYGDDHNMWLQPWEIMIQGHKNILEWKENFLKVLIVQGMTASNDVRMWKKDGIFINPIYETLKTNNCPCSSVVLCSQGGLESSYAQKWINWWKSSQPLAAEPYYYQSCLLLSEGKYEEFTRAADHYLFSTSGNSVSRVMLRYYYALTQLIHYKSYKSSLQNINLCLCAKPLMAEFWCLMADVYYHLLKRYDQAKQFYENAIILGSRRLKNDEFPMDISKYNMYPKKMINSCNQMSLM